MARQALTSHCQIFTVKHELELGTCRPEIWNHPNLAHLKAGVSLSNTNDPSDVDDDSVANASDNCPTMPNPGQEDFDGDGNGYVCDTSCPTTIDFTHTFGLGDVFNLRANQSIKYSGTINSGAVVFFDAGQGVVLKPGTSIDTGATFIINTTGCVQ